MAAEKGDVACLTLLLEAGADNKVPTGMYVQANTQSEAVVVGRVGRQIDHHGWHRIAGGSRERPLFGRNFSSKGNPPTTTASASCAATLTAPRRAVSPRVTVG